MDLSPLIRFGRLWLPGVLCLATGIVACSSGEEPLYDNPIVEQRADPWVYRNTDGRYFFTATVPEFNRIELRSARSLEALGSATPEVIWRKRHEGPLSADVWAPELHRINGTWYIYFSAGTTAEKHRIRMYVLSNDAEDPMTGEWTDAEKIETRYDAFALDATTFEHKGNRYLLWSQKDPDDVNPASLHISAMASPAELTGPEVLIAEPEYDWEMQGIPANQGASVLVRNGRVYVTYTASATDHRSAIGLLWADADADLLDPASWHKLPQPVFATHADSNRLGPGHGSFTLAEDGEADVFLYHSRRYLKLHRDDRLGDPNRHTRARALNWTDDGLPDFRQEKAD